MGVFLGFWGWFWSIKVVSEFENPQKDTLGTQIGPQKVIFSHFFYFVHFPIEIPIVVEKKLPPWEGKVLEQKQK